MSAQQPAAHRPELDPAGIEDLRRFRPAIEAALPGILDRFYTKTLATPALAKFFKDEQRVAHAKSAQARHWVSLFDARFDEEYHTSVHKIGLAHHKIGLPPGPYIAGYAAVLAELLGLAVDKAAGSLVPRGVRRNIARLVTTVSQVVLYDIGMAIDVYAAQGEAERTALIDAMVTRIDAQTRETIGNVGHLSGSLQESAKALGEASAEVNAGAEAAGQAADGALASSQAVAAAAQQLHASIAEISRQTAEAAQVSREVTHHMDEGRSVMQRLSDAAGEIGEVVGLISDIASRTNLLALNATIEAARAGEAGRGFAVVAGEVKNLASQSASSTSDISHRVATIQQVVEEISRSLKSTGEAVGRIEQTASAIAAAVEQQTSATSEIARSVAIAADASGSVADSMATVRSKGNVASSAAQMVSTNADQLNLSMLAMSQMIKKSLHTSTHLADRRAAARRAAFIPAELIVDGRASPGIVWEIGVGNMRLHTAQSFAPGARVTVRLPKDGIQLDCQAVRMIDDSVALTFDAAQLPEDRSATLARRSVADMLMATKAEFAAWSQSVGDTVAGGQPVRINTQPPGADFARWYEEATDLQLTAMAPYRDIFVPHRHVCMTGEAALKAHAAGRDHDAQTELAKLQHATPALTKLMDDLAREYGAAPAHAFRKAA